MLDSGWGQAPSAPGANGMVRTPASYASIAIRCPYNYVSNTSICLGLKILFEYRSLFISQ